MKIVIGLGNPGKKYQNTRHNLGFMIVGALAQEAQVKFKLSKKYSAEVAELATTTLLIKPLTFMNESGRTVKKILKAYRLNPADAIIIYDDIDLPFGQIKISGKGSAGHRGIQSVIDAIGQGFQRLRIGIENRQAYRTPKTESYVLNNYTAHELRQLRETVIPAALQKIKSQINIPFTYQ